MVFDPNIDTITTLSVADSVNALDIQNPLVESVNNLSSANYGVEESPQTTHVGVSDGNVVEFYDIFAEHTGRVPQATTEQFGITLDKISNQNNQELVFPDITAESSGRVPYATTEEIPIAVTYMEAAINQEITPLRPDVLNVHDADSYSFNISPTSHTTFHADNTSAIGQTTPSADQHKNSSYKGANPTEVVVIERQDYVRKPGNLKRVIKHGRVGG